MKLYVIPFLVLCGCSNLQIKEEPISTKVPNKIINTAVFSVDEKPLFNIKGDSHRDPNLKGDLIRQEYFINFIF